jgi:bacillopeptidase F
MRRLLTGMVLAGALAGPVLAGSFTEGLERYVAGRPDTEHIKVLVTLQEQADIATLDAELRERKASLAERHEAVISTLQNTARRTQPALVRELNTLRAAGKVNGYTPYWITNAVVVNAPISVLRTLAARPDVEAVDVDLVVQSILPVEPFKGRPAENDGQRTITAGLAAINADDVWNILGIDGTGALVGGIDTGVDYTHSTLVSRWRGSNGHPTSECWLDAAGLGHSLPQDNNGHGTHTMGTMVGGNDIGVAPGAQWIATNCINMSTGSAFDNAVIASFQFMADPDGNGATLDDVPDVVQNSWGVNESFSGYLNCDTRWWAAIDNCEAAGVCVTFSAGNEGSGASTLRSPADRCITPYSCFSVGATDPANGDLIASFSSRGPSTCSPAPYPIKPEVSAPG